MRLLPDGRHGPAGGGGGPWIWALNVEIGYVFSLYTLISCTLQMKMATTWWIDRLTGWEGCSPKAGSPSRMLVIWIYCPFFLYTRLLLDRDSIWRQFRPLCRSIYGPDKTLCSPMGVNTCCTCRVHISDLLIYCIVIFLMVAFLFII